MTFIISTSISYGIFYVNIKIVKYIALLATVINLILSVIIYIIYDNSFNQFQIVQEYINISFLNLNLGFDGLSIFFILLTTIIMFISLLSN